MMLVQAMMPGPGADCVLVHASQSGDRCAAAGDAASVQPTATANNAANPRPEIASISSPVIGRMAAASDDRPVSSDSSDSSAKIRPPQGLTGTRYRVSASPPSSA